MTIANVGFSGSTLVATRDGSFRLIDLVGKMILIRTSTGWTGSTVASLCSGPVRRLTFSDGTCVDAGLDQTWIDRRWRSDTLWMEQLTATSRVQPGSYLAASIAGRRTAVGRRVTSVQAQNPQLLYGLRLLDQEPCAVPCLTNGVICFTLSN